MKDIVVVLVIIFVTTIAAIRRILFVIPLCCIDSIGGTYLVFLGWVILEKIISRVTYLIVKGLNINMMGP